MSRNAFRKYSAIWHYCLAPHVVNSWVQEQPFTRPLRNNATSIFNSGLVPLSIWQNIGVALRGTSGLHNSTPKKVALQSAVVIDYGRTAVVEGLRVAPWERGKGIAKAIYRYCRDTVKTYYPDVKTERMMMEGPLSQIPVSDTDLLCTRMILYLCFKTEDIQKITKELILKLSQTEEYHQPVTLQVDQVRNIYLNSKVILSLLPEKTIIQNWQPLKPLKKNLNILLDRGSTWLADSIDNPKFLSLDTYPYRVPLEKGYCFNIDLFGKDLTGAKNLFLGHMQSLPQSLNTLIFCHVYFDPSLKEGMVEFCEKIPGLERFKECSEQMLFEREI
ncbi:histidine N-acetyltransferase-like isoform X2 [Latimeria chalumnae]|uniref:histidine N-acetyltransferase-like isoform X2 n=1 Tax=Latimeria chalumnae TaxID=7897 RepID=UPI00313E4653